MNRAEGSQTICALALVALVSIITYTHQQISWRKTVSAAARSVFEPSPRYALSDGEVLSMLNTAVSASEIDESFECMDLQKVVRSYPLGNAPRYLGITCTPNPLRWRLEGGKLWYVDDIRKIKEKP